MDKLKKPKYIESPSRNFCVLNASVMNDPKDGKDKLMFTSFVDGGTGIFAIIDPKTDTGESYLFPCDNGAWAVCRVDERRVAIGTCATKGAIHTFDLIDRKFIKTTYVPGNTYVWNLVMASDGNLYGGTYYGNVIVKYSPETMEAEVVTRCDEYTGNYYSRTVYADVNGSGNILVSSGMDVPNVCVYNIYEKKVTANIPGNITTINDVYFGVKDAKGGFFDKKDADGTAYFDRKTCKQISADQLPAPVNSEKDRSLLSDGTKAFIYKQGYKYIDENGQSYVRKNPVIPPPTGIMNIACDEKDNVWGASGFGQTIFSLDPDTGSFKNTNQVTDNGGEVYGIVPIKDRVYLTAYIGCMHIVYYPDKPWSQEDNTNPNTFRLFSSEGYARPEGRSIIGPDGNIYTGLMANYGVYGGAVTKLCIDTNETAIWENKINDYAIGGIFADRKYVYAITCGQGNGMPTRDVPTYVFRLDCDLNLVESIDCGKKYFAGAAMLDGVVCVACYDGEENKQYLWYSSDNFKTIKKIPVDFRISGLIVVPKKNMFVFSTENRMGKLDCDGNFEFIYEFERYVNRICSAPSGRVFASCEEQVFECEF